MNIADILQKHLAWLMDEEGGKRDNLAEIEKAQLSILPDEGDVIGWKKCRNKVIVKLRILNGTPMGNATGRKCRAESAEVLEIFGAEVAISLHDPNFEYRKGEIVKAPNWEPDRFIECGRGIHFFITRVEAEAYC